MEIHGFELPKYLIIMGSTEVLLFKGIANYCGPPDQVWWAHSRPASMYTLVEEVLEVRNQFARTLRENTWENFFAGEVL